MAKESKMIVCKHCGHEIAASAKTCPQCGGKNKKPFYKRPWFIVLAILVILSVIAGRKGASDDSKKVNSTSELLSTASDAQDTTDTKVTASESPSQKTVEKEEVESEIKEIASERPTPEINNVVLYEGNNVIITAKEIEKSGNNYDINLLIENNSSLNLGFNAHAYAVNGIMTRNNIYAMDCDVAAGKKANVSLEIKGSVLDEYGITDIRCVDVLFWAYDNDKMYKAFDTDQIEIKTSLYDGMHDTIQGTTIYDVDGIIIDYLSTVGDQYNFCITNTTGSYLNFDFNEISVNDFTNSETDYDLYDEMILNNCQIVVSVDVDNNFKAENGINSVDTIEWNMSLRPYGDYFNETKIGPIIFNVK